MAPNLTGPVTVAVAAINSAGFVIADGMTTQQDINVGGQTIVVVTLVSGYMPPVDAGSDATRDRRQRWNAVASLGRAEWAASAGPAVWGAAAKGRAAAELAAKGRAAAVPAGRWNGWSERTAGRGRAA